MAHKLCHLALKEEMLAQARPGQVLAAGSSRIRPKDSIPLPPPTNWRYQLCVPLVNISIIILFSPRRPICVIKKYPSLSCSFCICICICNFIRRYICICICSTAFFIFCFLRHQLTLVPFAFVLRNWPMGAEKTKIIKKKGATED